jgi:hypothetical protein
MQGRIQRGGGGGAPAPPKIGKNMIFWGKIVIFNTKYPNNFRASLSSAQFFLSAPPPNLKSWIRPCNVSEWSEMPIHGLLFQWVG